ncbi:VOC family protein [Paenibacillus lautus]|uniref:VOC family protein n=1 Tax=Paenibacillus lautus TaxID=1401 RepID=UPI001C7DBA99|nr:VOC family protein [Paenibacillus lautus]MBX4152084.1 VOC family protein [Paenibacillus lautus]
MQAQMVPFIISEDARGQANFYMQALGGEIDLLTTFKDMPGIPEAHQDKVMHMSLTLAGGNKLILTDAFQETGKSTSMGMAITFVHEEDARAAYRHLSDGGTEKYPFALQPWGAYYGEVVDRYGMTWQMVHQG